MREVEQADYILVVGCDPVNEAPMLAMAMRQAFRKGASVAVIDPRPVFLPMDFEHLPFTPDEFDPCLAVLIRGAVPQRPWKPWGPRPEEYYETLPETYSPDPEI